MGLLEWIGIFVLALAILLKASDYFIKAAEKVGLALGIPSFIIGVTIVAAGTSLPELISSIFAVIENHPEMVVGNVIGSNITNILLVLGLTAIAKHIDIKFDILNIDMPLFIGSAFLLWFMLFDKIFTTVEAVICLIGLAIFLGYTFGADREGEKDERPKLTSITFLMLIGGGIGIWGGAKYTVDAVIAISAIMGIGTDIVALSMVAFGTSIPEIIVSIGAARRGNPEMAVGNVLGSNIFNTFAVMGIPALFGTLIIPETTIFSLPIMMGASVLFVIMTFSKKISKWEGMMLFLLYIIFINELVNATM